MKIIGNNEEGLQKFPNGFQSLWFVYKGVYKLYTSSLHIVETVWKLSSFPNSFQI